MLLTAPLPFRPTRLTGLLLCLLLCTLPSACLEFDAQDVVVVHDPGKDRIDAVLIYRGLFAESSSDEDKMKKALSDLDASLQTGEFCLWNNWPLSIDLTLERPAPIKALMQHVDVENGGLFTDPTGQLCAWQFVRIREVSAFVDKVNTLLEVAVQGSLLTGFRLRGETRKPSDDTREFVREFLRAKEKMLQVDGNRVALAMPLAQEDIAWLLSLLEDHFLNNVSAEQVRIEEGFVAAGKTFESSKDLRRQSLAASPSYRFFWDNAVSLDRRTERTTVAFGTVDAEQLRLRKAAEGQYEDGLLKRLRADGRKIEDGIPDAELMRRFDEFRGRDAQLPPKLAALRAQ